MMATINWGDLWKFAGVVPGKPARPAPPPLPQPPVTIDIYDLLLEMEACFKESEHHWTGEGPITRPVVAMRRLVVELAKRQLR